MVSTAKSFPSVFGENAITSGNAIVVSASTFRIKQKGLTAAWARFFRSSARERDLVSAESFLITLENETKRSDRSGKSFALVLLGGAGLVESNDDVFVRKLQSSVCSILRDIDLVGWYDDGATIGIICREIGSDSVAASRAIVTRIQNALDKSLKPEQVQKLSVTWHLFSGAPRKVKKAEVVCSEVSDAELQQLRRRDLRAPETVSHLGLVRTRVVVNPISVFKQTTRFVPHVSAYRTPPLKAVYFSMNEIDSTQND